MLDRRRLLLRGLVTLPLIGGGVTLIGKSAARVPLSDVAAAPLLADPHQRAQYAWTAFADAMRDLTADSDGWLVVGGEQVRAVGYMPVQAPWLKAEAVNIVPMYSNGRGLVERNTRLDLA